MSYIKYSAAPRFYPAKTHNNRSISALKDYQHMQESFPQQSPSQLIATQDSQASEGHKLPGKGI